MNLHMIRAVRLVNAQQKGLPAVDFIAALDDSDVDDAFQELLRRRGGGARNAVSAVVDALSVADAVDYLTTGHFLAPYIAASSTAMSAIAASSTAMEAVLSSSTALTAIFFVPTAKAAIMSSTALAKASVPKMTGATTPSGIASAKTSHNAQYAAWLAFDGNDATFWNSAGSAAGEWIQYQFPADVFVHSMTVSQYGSAFSPKDCILQKSVDGVTFVDVKAMTLPATGIASMDVASTGFCKYWRLSISSNYGAGYAALKELNFTGFVKP